jgi:ATPase subunit of ABC transporter with duplicated ATPase domains
MRYLAHVLFDEVTTTFQQGRRYAITGPNGSGNQQPKNAIGSQAC